MRKFTLSATSIALIFLSVMPAQSAGKLGVGDLSLSATYSLDKCQTKIELDCIESVGIVDKQGTYFDGEYLTGTAENVYIDSLGNQNYSGHTIWRAAGKDISLVSQLDTPNHIIDKFGGTNHYGAALRIFTSVEDPLNTKVRIVVRTSWLKPQSIQVKEFESNYSDEIVPGGHRWTFEGMGLKHSSFNGARPANTEARADYDAILFDIFLHHAGIDANHSFWPPVCADKGYTVQSNNTNATGEPMWDPGSNSLIFGIFAPHFTTTGDINLGYFKFWTTDEFLNCKFPTNTLSKSPDLVVQILNEDGTETVATTQVTHTNGKIYLLAAGFHFSSPKIVLKASATASPAPQASSTATPSSTNPPIQKKFTIKCQKGKSVKTITSARPQCPAGYKKVK